VGVVDAGFAVIRPVPCRSDDVGCWDGLPAARTDGGALTGRAVLGTGALITVLGGGGGADAVIACRDGPPDTGGGLFRSGVPKALNRAFNPFVPCVNLLSAILPTFEICVSSTGANPSVLVVENALEAYNSNPIIPNKISIVVPGFIAF
jgi:hypothetical protein